MCRIDDVGSLSDLLDKQGQLGTSQQNGIDGLGSHPFNRRQSNRSISGPLATFHGCEYSCVQRPLHIFGQSYNADVLLPQRTHIDACICQAQHSDSARAAATYLFESYIDNTENWPSEGLGELGSEHMRRIRCDDEEVAPLCHIPGRI